MELLIYEKYNGKYRLYMHYHFDSNGFISNNQRIQPCPSHHKLEIVVNKYIIFSGFGFNMKNKLYNLPQQKYETSKLNIFSGKDFDNLSPDPHHPKGLWRQYGNIRIFFKKVTFVPMRDHEQGNKHCMIYCPVRVVL